MDDEASILKMAGRLLSKMGYETVTAMEGALALELFSEALQSGRPFKLVILDLTIPGGMGGRDTIKEMLKINPDVTALVSSGYSNDPVMSQFREYGFKGVVPKPYTRDDLATALNQLIKTK